MVREDVILAIDEGTTSARTIIIDHLGKMIGKGGVPLQQYYPHVGWVEQDPEQIWSAQLESIKKALNDTKIEPAQISAIGITNQRETTILWDKNTHKPVYNAIVWQCRRTAGIVEKLKYNYGDLIKEKTGLIVDSYFSGPKIAWMLDNVPNLRERANKGDILFGTVDSYLIYRLTGGKVHATDYSNASRTMLFDIEKLEWSSDLLEIMNIPESMLPEALPSSGLIGYTNKEILGSEIPITSAVGDQQAALFGHRAYENGDSKCTYGTGNFLLMNTGNRRVQSDRLLTTIAWGLEDTLTYALEGSIFITGAAVQWLRDSIGIIKDVEEAENLATSIDNNEGVYFVPALTGLGAPYWDQYARGSITGITRGTGRAQIVRAALESIAYQTRDVVDEMLRDSGLKLELLRVDGGASRNNFLMQFQADILGTFISRPRDIEATAKGAAYLAGLATGFWEGVDELKKLKFEADLFKPQMKVTEKERLYEAWTRAVKSVTGDHNFPEKRSETPL